MKTRSVMIVIATACIGLGSTAWAQSAARAGAARGLFQEIMARADLDGDGAISSEEAESAQAQRFASLDTDGDGRLIEDEFVESIQENARARLRPRLSDHFAELDADGDGHVTSEEFAAAGTERFSAIDADGDGFATSDEIRMMVRQRRGDRNGN